jgi:competence protein ComEC
VIVTLRFRSPVEFTALDVGQGDGLFLRSPKGTTCLIDAGSTSVKNIGEYRILPYLKYEGAAVLDYIILTHLDEDHMSGVRELLELQDTLDGIKIQQILFPAIANPDEKYLGIWNLAKEKNITVGTIGAGDKIKEENFEISCIYPVKGIYIEDKNDSSTVLQVTYQDFSMLLSGDLGFGGEEKLLQMGVLRDIDIWKVSHHGSKYSGSERFLQSINPQLSLISVGRNTYGHPNEELLERIHAVGSLTETTLDHGALMIESDGKTFSLSFGR